MAEFDYLDVCGGIALRLRDPDRAAAYLREQIEAAFVANAQHERWMKWANDLAMLATARAEAAEAREAALREALLDIQNRDWVENCLHPQWSAERAISALGETQ